MKFDQDNKKKRRKIRNKKREFIHVSYDEYLEDIFDADKEDIYSLIEYIYEHEGD